MSLITVFGEILDVLAPFRERPLPSKAIATSLESLPCSHSSVTSFIKRFIDIAGAVAGLGLAIVLFIPIAFAVQFDSPGPVFYSQVRCGYRGRSFRMWKFRSMVVNAEALKHLVQNEAQGLIFKNQNDPRITQVGAFLRRTSLDELPQFWNVLWGDMSLVGTRPPTPDEVADYTPHHWQRLEVKPGITGEWQARGRSSVKDFEAIVAMDLAYQAQWTVWYDLKLLWLTVVEVLRRRGAC